MPTHPANSDHRGTVTSPRESRPDTPATRNQQLFRGLTSLSADVATALTAFEGTVLHLNGLKQITLETARSLATSRTEVLDLGGLAKPAVDLLVALGDVSGTGIILGLDVLPAEHGRLLATFKLRRLRFTGAADLTVETAAAMAALRGDQRWFERAPVKLTPEVARAVASFRGPSLALDGIATFSNESARKLSFFRGEVLTANGNVDIPPRDSLEMVGE